MELSRNLTDVFEDGFVKDKKKVMAQRAGKRSRPS